MLSLGAFGFLQPWFLAGLVVVPLLWWLLRATPPRPRKVSFPGVRILLGLEDRERVPARTPWWLLLLRCLAAALALLAFAEPLLNPKARIESTAPLLVMFDGGWTSAADWPARRAEALDAIAQAGEADRPVAVANLAGAGPAPEALVFGPAEEQAEAVRALDPAPWRPDPARLDTALAALADEPFDTLWLTDGLAPRARQTDDAEAGSGAKARLALMKALTERGAVIMLTAVADPVALETPRIVDGALVVAARRPEGGLLAQQTIRVAAFGQPGSGSEDGDEAESGAAAERIAFDADSVGSAVERRLAVAEIEFLPDETRAETEIDLPLELRNAVTRLAIVGGGSAGAVSLLDASHRRRAVALVQGDETHSGQPLLSDLHFLRAALAPHAAAREMDLRAALGMPADRDSAGFRENAGSGNGVLGLADDGEAPRQSVAWADVIVLSDIGRVDEETAIALTEWVQSGGLLLRFAGPRLAALANDRSGPRVRAFDGRDSDAEILLPTPLRGGGRALGGALSWSSPQKMRAFPETSPFAGLEIAEEVTVSRQVLAEPGPDLAKRVWAALSDGTPLVTARDVGKGRVVLFHVTASAAWSNLPLSGLFVDMVGRVVSAAPGVSGGEAALAEASRSWRPAVTLDGFGQASPAPARAEPVDGAALAKAAMFGASADAPPAVYVAETDEGAAALAVNAFGAEESFMRADPPLSAVTMRPLSTIEELELKPALLSAVLALLSIDVLAALFVGGRLRRSAAAALILALGAATLAVPAGDALAQTTNGAASADPSASVERFNPAERLAATETILAYVQTGDASVDRISAAGLWGLSAILNERTSIEPGEPAGIDLERDEVAVYSLLYWPVTDRQPTPSDAAIRKLNAFLSTGGLLVVDTRDANQAFGGGEGPMGPHLRRLIGGLDLPALELLPRDHVLTRTYYLLDDAPGRWNGGAVWVEIGGSTDIFDPNYGVEASANDGVSPVVIGSADWAGAWAVTPEGSYLAPMGRGGDAQRETAFRFGVNLVMYAFTGNYKSDQVHIPVLLERLGN